MIKILEFLNIITLSGNGNISDINSGTIASIISLVLTIGIFYGVGRIKSYYTIMIRAPEILAELDTIRSDIANYLNDFESNTYKISEKLILAEAKLTSLKKNFKGRSAKTIYKLIKSIKSYNDRSKQWILRQLYKVGLIDLNSMNESRVRDIYFNLYKVLVETEELQKDLKWER